MEQTSLFVNGERSWRSDITLPSGALNIQSALAVRIDHTGIAPSNSAREGAASPRSMIELLFK